MQFVDMDSLLVWIGSWILLWNLSFVDLFGWFYMYMNFIFVLVDSPMTWMVLFRVTDWNFLGFSFDLDILKLHFLFLFNIGR